MKECLNSWSEKETHDNTECYFRPFIGTTQLNPNWVPNTPVQNFNGVNHWMQSYYKHQQMLYDQPQAFKYLHPGCFM